MNKLRKFPRKLGFIVGASINVFCIGHCIFEYGAEITFLTGPSMIPTFNSTTNTNVVITEKISSRLNGISVGDIVISKSPVDPANLICKRVAASGGDRIRRSDGMYGESPRKYFEIPRGHLWLVGDNPENSTDSRSYGPVPVGLVRGKVCYKIWPLSEFGRIV